MLADYGRASLMLPYGVVDDGLVCFGRKGRWQITVVPPLCCPTVWLMMAWCVLWGKGPLADYGRASLMLLYGVVGC
ncbi:hypothetical protein [Marinomonas shanghaiensis]|uniref:hypothetical protein n=1 Tax=Marinomonas shanghaiensis TaxID=2202418 RepID=UPI000DB902FA|nr:hypothetical protein [Marinomonas shanghaiensis]